MDDTEISIREDENQITIKIMSGGISNEDIINKIKNKEYKILPILIEYCRRSKLELCFNNITDEIFEDIVEGLSKNKDFNEIRIVGNYLTDKSIKLLTEKLSVEQYIIIDLKHNNTSELSRDYLAQWINTNEHLQWVTVSIDNNKSEGISQILGLNELKQHYKENIKTLKIKKD